MIKNVGSVERVIRVVVGLALPWHATLAAPTGNNWIGWNGICPLYPAIGASTCSAKRV